MNIIQISFLLGHAGLDTTMRYLDITTGDKRKALATTLNIPYQTLHGAKTSAEKGNGDCDFSVMLPVRQLVQGNDALILIDLPDHSLLRILFRK